MGVKWVCATNHLLSLSLSLGTAQVQRHRESTARTRLAGKNGFTVRPAEKRGWESAAGKAHGAWRAAGVHGRMHQSRAQQTHSTYEHNVWGVGSRWLCNKSSSP
eukprot:1274526-Amphidinium_carterae.1